MEFELEQNTLMISPHLCIVCCGEVNDTEENSNEIPKSERLIVLSNVLRLSQTIYQGLNITKLQELFYCSSCTKTILNSLTILQEIKALEKSLTVLTNKLKQDLIQSYNARQVEENDSSYSTPGEVAIDLIRKTFVQCWSDCTVQLPKLNSVKEQGRPIHSIPDDGDDIIIVPHSVVSWQPDYDLSCFDHRDNGVSSKSLEVPEVKFDENIVSNVKCRVKKPTYKTFHECSDSDGSVVDLFDPGSGSDFNEDSTRKRKKKQSPSKVKRPKIKKSKNILEDSHDEQNPTSDNTCEISESGPFVRRKNIQAQLKGVTLHCNLCEKTFQTTAALNTHIANIHDKTYKFFCHICGQGFQVNSMLQRHITYVHTTEKNFECDVCQKRFKRSHQLFYHKRVHTGERLICEICGRGFMQPEKLKAHLVIHTGEKRHPCPFCNKFFAIKQYVTNHIKDTHEGKRKGRNKRPTVRASELTNIESSEALEHTSIVTNSLLQSSDETLSKPVAEVWRRQLNEEIRVAEIEIAQDSQQEARTSTAKFGENYVLKFISGI